jgi:hypothetical protein
LEPADFFRDAASETMRIVATKTMYAITIDRLAFALPRSRLLSDAEVGPWGSLQIVITKMTPNIDREWVPQYDSRQR